MGAAVVYPKSTLLALTYLRDLLPAAYGQTVTIAAKVPNPRPDGGLVVVRRIGGVADLAYRDRPRLDVQVWHPDEAEAEHLAELTRGLMKQATNTVVDGVTIGRTADFLGLTPVPDPESGSPRFLFTVEWQVPGVQL